MTLAMNYPNGYDPTATAGLIHNPVHPLSQAQPHPHLSPVPPQQHQHHQHQHQPQHQFQHQHHQYQQQHQHQQQQQQQQQQHSQPPQAHRQVRPGHPQIFLGQQQPQPPPQHQQWHPVQAQAPPPHPPPPPLAHTAHIPTAPSPAPVPGQPQYYEASSHSPPLRHLPEQRQTPHPQYSPLPPSAAATTTTTTTTAAPATTASFEPSSLVLQQPEQVQPERPHYGSNPGAGMPYGMPSGRVPLGGPPIYPAKQPAMTGHQSPYTGAPYVRAGSNPPGMSPFPPAQTPSAPGSVHGASPGPPSHQPYLSSAQPASAVPPQQSTPPSQYQPSHVPPPPPQQQQPQNYPPAQPRQMSVPPPQSRSSMSSSTRPAVSSPGGPRMHFQPPLSPGEMEREKERVSLLLQLNTELLREIVRMQAEGKAGPTPRPEPAGDTSHVDFSETMRCLQANLAYLAAVADRTHKPTAPVPRRPAIMVAPRSVPAVEDLYAQLNALFSDAPSNGSPGGMSSWGAASPSGVQVPMSAPTPGSGVGAPILTPEASMGEHAGRPSQPPHPRAGLVQADPQQHQQYKRWPGEVNGAAGHPGMDVFEQHPNPVMAKPNGPMFETHAPMRPQHYPLSAVPYPGPAFQ